jgi:hypothetical protein
MLCTLAFWQNNRRFKECGFDNVEQLIDYYDTVLQHPLTRENFYPTLKASLHVLQCAGALLIDINNDLLAIVVSEHYDLDSFIKISIPYVLKDWWPTVSSEELVPLDDKGYVVAACDQPQPKKKSLKKRRMLPYGMCSLLYIPVKWSCIVLKYMFCIGCCFTCPGSSNSRDETELIPE